MSLLSSLYTGTSGLRVSQHAINTTAHNLANVDTKGFTRQQVILTDNTYSTLGSNRVGVFQIGTGTDISKVMTYRNMFYDQSYRENNGRLGFYSAQYEAVSEIENLLGETEGVAFQNSVSSLWTNLQELSKDPGNIVVRSNFVNACVSFTERSQNIMDQLSEYQKSLNTNIVAQVDRINSIGSQITELNKKICAVEAGDIERANDYRDQRNVLLDELSEIVNISCSEDSSGAVSVSIEGTQFLSGGRYYEMGVAKVNEASSLLKPVWNHLGGQDVFNLDQEISTELDTDIGYLKGLIIGRGNKEANYSDIPIKPVRDDYASDQDYNTALADYEDAVKEYNKTVDVSSIMTMQAQFDQLIHGIVTMMNDILCPNTTVTDAVTGETYTVLDTDKAPVGMDENATQGVELFSRNNCSRYEEKVINGKTYQVYKEEDPSDIHTLYSINQISVNQEILSNYSVLALSSNNGSGEFDLEVCKSLTEQWQKPFATLSPNTLTEFDFNSYYTNMIGELANRGNKFSTLAESQQLTVETIDGQRQSVTGVSSDEELTNLIRFQHAYSASSRYITTVNDMLETLLNM